MKLLEQKEIYKVSPLFDGWDETMIWSCLQGYMGEAWVDCTESPQSAQIIVGDFCFFAGVPNIELSENIPASFQSPCILMIPQNGGWCETIETAHEGSFDKFMRYAMKKEPDIFNREKLFAFTQNLPQGYKLQKIGQRLYHSIQKSSWAKDLCSQFPTWEAYEKHGIGYAVIYNGEIVSGASSYTVYQNGIEIEIDTHEDFRRKGLALACASTLILDCLEKGLFPSWDAANQASVHLAEKLGYHFDREYVAYEVTAGRRYSK